MSVRHVEPVMGTVFSIVADVGDGIPEALARLHAIDAKFSTYRPDSVISRMARGEPVAYDPEVAEVLERCAEIEADTNGAFSARPDGRLDPSGWVKGWAIEETSRLLTASGSGSHLIVGGGDVQAHGEAEEGRPWTIGIADPLEPGRFVALVSGTDFAVATSGTTERGDHILDPLTGRPAVGFASVTVIGERIARADAYATAVFAMGPDRGLEWVEKQDGFEAYAVLTGGQTVETGGFAEYLTG
ncbi:FAD:protein FMN transferase [Catenulispora yoronensis]|uniref:FAD:protein FMN transferase n=1 Tax=Catenulispora yoronensis TaxID=450799 RepID=A0ABN2TTC0_9ACTN